MHEILAQLDASHWVLDLGSRQGSFALSATAARVIRLDLDPCGIPPFVQGDARRLPFRDGSVAAVIANHSLEHIEGLDECLAEIGRVLSPSGLLYVAVPDFSTLSDRLYRWLSHGGGHVNAIVSPDRFVERIAAQVPGRLAGSRMLYSSFAFLNRNGPVRWPRRVYLVGGGYEFTLRQANRVFRLIDRLLRTRTGVYGWAFYFGELDGIDPVPSQNVCMRCGAGHFSEWLLALGKVSGPSFWRSFYCPDCGALNPFFMDSIRS